MSDDDEAVDVRALIALSELHQRQREMKQWREDMKDEKAQNDRIQLLTEHVARLWTAIAGIQMLAEPLNGKLSGNSNSVTLKFGSASIKLHKSGRVDIRGGRVSIKGSYVSVVGTVDATMTDLSP